MGEPQARAGTSGHNFSPVLSFPSVPPPSPSPSSDPYLPEGVTPGSRWKGLLPPAEKGAELGGRAPRGEGVLPAPSQDARGSAARAAAAAGRLLPGDGGALRRRLETQEAVSADGPAPVPGGCQPKQAWLF